MGKVNVVVRIYAGVPEDVEVYEDSKDAERNVRGFFDSYDLPTEQRNIVENGTQDELLEFLSDYIGSCPKDEIWWFVTALKKKKLKRR